MPTVSIILNYFFGGTALVAIYIAWKSRKSSIKQAEATALLTVDSIYNKMTIRVDKEIEKYEKIIVSKMKKLILKLKKLRKTVMKLKQQKSC